MRERQRRREYKRRMERERCTRDAYIKSMEMLLGAVWYEHMGRFVRMDERSLRSSRTRYKFNGEVDNDPPPTIHKTMERFLL